MKAAVARAERPPLSFSAHPGQEVSDVPRRYHPIDFPSNDLEIPDFLRVENRRPLTSEQRAPLDAALAAARAPQRARDDLRALQVATKREKSRIRIEKLLARKSGAAARMPLSGREALVAINQPNCPPGKTAAARPAAENG